MVGHSVAAHDGRADQRLYRGCHLVVDQSAGLEEGKAVVALEAVAEGLLHAARKEVAEVAHQVGRRCPLQFVRLVDDV